MPPEPFFPDRRFFETAAPIALGDLAARCGAAILRGDGTANIARVASLTRGTPDSIAFLVDGRMALVLGDTAAGACFVSDPAVTAPKECALLLAPAPYAAWVTAAELLHRPIRHPPQAPAVHPLATLEDGAILAPGSVVGPGAAIGRGTYISAGAVIGPGVAIGRDGYVGPGAAIGFALIGDRVKIYAGAAIGEPGFGATAGPSGVVDVPQLGRVILQDGVTIGANSCVDRGAYEDTVIGENTKIDNHVQIAHNVVIGRNCLLAAQTGVSGSVTIGDGCMFGGRVGVADHLSIGAGARIAAGSGVPKNIPAGESWGGYPAKPMRQWLREAGALSSLAVRRRPREERQ